MKPFFKAMVGILSWTVMISSYTALQVGAERLSRPYDWTVKVATSKPKHQFEYTGSAIRPVVKAHVTYFHGSDEPDSGTQLYQDLWYHDGKPLGLERAKKFDVNQGEGISILFAPSSESADDDEYLAAANAILRTMLDAYVNRNPVVTVRVPDASDLNRLSLALQSQGASDSPPGPEVPVASVMNIFLQTEPDGTDHQTLYYF